MKRGARVFVSYCAEDSAYLDELDRHLSTLRRQGVVDVWHDRLLRAGQSRRVEMAAQLERADIVLVLLSSDYLACDDCYDHQLVPAMALQASHRTALIPVLVRPVDLTGLPVARLKRLPADGRPLSDRANRDHAWVEVEREIRAAARAPDGSGSPTRAPVEGNGLRKRIREAELPRERELKEVVRALERHKPVVVLAPKRGGISTFLSQVRRHLRSTAHDWTVLRVSAQAEAGEAIGPYQDRLRQVMRVDEPGNRVLACVHRWGRNPEEHRDALARMLRNLLDGAALAARDFSLLALGGHSLFLQRYGNGEHSLLNICEEVTLPDLTAEDIAALMNQIAPGQWDGQDAAEVALQSGGHPLLVKRILEQWVEDPASSWSELARVIEDDHDFLLPVLVRQAQIPASRKVLARALHGGNRGIAYPRFNPRSAAVRLHFVGLLRQHKNRLYLRCPAVESLVEQMLQQEE